MLTVVGCESTQAITTSTKDEATPDIAIIEETTVPPTTPPITTEPPTTEPPTTEPVTEEVYMEEEIVEEEYIGETEAEIVYEYETEEETPKKENTYDTSDSDVDLLARTIYQEAGTCSEYCQWLVGSTVMNLADERGGLESVVFHYNTFNVAYSLYNATPSDLSYSVANRVMSGDRDYAVKAFRMNYYHEFGTPYCVVDGVYFSTY